MREICRAEGLTVDQFLDYLKKVDPAAYDFEMPVIAEIRRQKSLGLRAKPSTNLVDKSSMFNHEQRCALIDRIAELVDENATGRSDMCRQFALLLDKALKHLGFSSRIAVGSPVYYDASGRTTYRWNDDGHDWVLVGDELIDGNVDSLIENPEVPNKARIAPYWGPKKEVPPDRKFNENRGARTRPRDNDVEDTWWPELRDWIETKYTVFSTLSVSIVEAAEVPECTKP